MAHERLSTFFDHRFKLLVLELCIKKIVQVLGVFGLLPAGIFKEGQGFLDSAFIDVLERVKGEALGIRGGTSAYKESKKDGRDADVLHRSKTVCSISRTCER